MPNDGIGTYDLQLWALIIAALIAVFMLMVASVCAWLRAPVLGIIPMFLGWALMAFVLGSWWTEVLTEELPPQGVVMGTISAAVVVVLFSSPVFKKQP